jgi:alpha-1,3-rhamnosyl/mannosyltransferase
MEVVLGIDAIKYPLTGIGRYTYELAKGLQFSSDIEKLHFLKGEQIQTNSELIEATFNIEAGGKFNNKFRSLLGSLSPAVMIYQLHKEWSQKKALKPYKNTIFHGPNYYLPNHDGPCVSTFHDLSIFKYPAFHPQARRTYMAKELPKALKRADVIITDSNYTRAEVIEYSGFDPSRVVAIPLAASEEFQTRTENDCLETLSKYQVNYQGYVLYAGTVEPRKNLMSLLDAYEALPTSLRQNTPLVVAGYKGWRSEDVHERLEKAHAAGWAKYLGFVTAEDLRILFSAAKTFVYPIVILGAGPVEQEIKDHAKKNGLTNIHFLGALPDNDKVSLLMLSYAVLFPSHLRSEAFGISLLEGAMYGKPMISSEIGTGTTFINIANETGLVVPPSDPDALRSAMRHLWEQPELAAEMGRRAEERYWTYFTAKKMSDSYVELYKSLLTSKAELPCSSAHPKSNGKPT